MKKIIKYGAFYTAIFVVGLVLKQITINQVLGVYSGDTNKLIFLVYLLTLHLIAAYGLLSPIFNKFFNKSDK